jgi:hypothetical protein
MPTYGIEATKQKTAHVEQEWFPTWRWHAGNLWCDAQDGSSSSWESPDQRLRPGQPEGRFLNEIAIQRIRDRQDRNASALYLRFRRCSAEVSRTEIDRTGRRSGHGREAGIGANRRRPGGPPHDADRE